MDKMHPIDGSNPGLISKVYFPYSQEGRANDRSAFGKAFMSIGPWFYRHRQAVTIPIVKKFFTKLRELHPDTKIGVAGFCWGGRYAILLGQTQFNDTQLVDAVFAGHPSLVSIPADVSDPQVPVSIAVASTDSVFSPAMAAKTEKLWVGYGIDYEIEIYEGAKHGFCVRGNMKNDKEKGDMMKASEQVLKGEMGLTVGCQLVQKVLEVMRFLASLEQFALLRVVSGIWDLFRVYDYVTVYNKNGR
jgi:dienelactone hydrolase